MRQNLPQTQVLAPLKMFAILKEIKVETTSLISLIFDRVFCLKLGSTTISLKARSCTLSVVFECNRNDVLSVKVGKEEFKINFDCEKNEFYFDFKKLKIFLKFQFSKSDWSAFGVDIEDIGKYNDKKYYVNEETLESSFNPQFNLSKNFPSFSYVIKNDKKLYIDHINKFVIPTTPAIRQNSVKMKLKSYLLSQNFKPFIFNPPIIKIDRVNLLKSSQQQLLKFLKTNKIQDMIVCFNDEIGEDHGAIRKEFIYLLFNSLVMDPRIITNEQISDVNAAIPCEDFLYEYENSSHISNILDEFIYEREFDSSTFFILLGVTIGALFILGETVNINFSFIFYENLLKRKYTIRHIQDSEIQRSLNYLNSSEIEETIFENFVKSKRNQYDHIRFGFKTVIDEIDRFTAFDFPFIFFHFEPILIENLKRMVKYDRCDTQTREIVWLWEALNQKDQSFLSKFLLFVSGSGCLPRFEEETSFIFDKTKYLNVPLKASVCNKRLYIPEYSSFDKLLYYLDLSVLNTEGFHYV